MSSNVSNVNLTIKKESGEFGTTLSISILGEVPEVPVSLDVFTQSTSSFQSCMLIQNVPYCIESFALEKLLTPPSCNYSVKVFNDGKDPIRRSKFALFDTTLGASKCLNYLRTLHNNNSLKVSAGKLGGSHFYCQQYQKQFSVSPDDLKQDIEEWLMKFSEEERKMKDAMKSAAVEKDEENEEEAADGEDGDVNVDETKVDDEEWTVVSRHGKRRVKKGGVAFTLRNQDRAKQRVVILSFNCAISAIDVNHRN